MITHDQIDNALNYLFKTNADLTKTEHEIMLLLNDGLYSGNCYGTVESGAKFLERFGYKIQK
jgi:hypothetical protein